MSGDYYFVRDDENSINKWLKINGTNLINHILKNSNKIVLKTLDLTSHNHIKNKIIFKLIYTKTSLITLRFLCDYFDSDEIEPNKVAIPNVIIFKFI